MHEGALPQPSSLREILADPALRVIMLVVFVIMLGFGSPVFWRKAFSASAASGMLS